MSLANDKVSVVQRAIGANALVASRVIRSGFTNVVQSDTYNFASGNRGENVVFYGETAPGANYNSIAKIGDEYIMLTFTAGAITQAAKYLFTASGWQLYTLDGASYSTGAISIYGSDGAYKASYTTIDLACAALANGDILKIRAGEYTLTGAINITKTDVQIIGEDCVRVNCAVGADYGFKTVFGAISSTKGITFKNLEISAADDATQQAIRIENTSATGRINVYINDVDFESDGGDSIHVDHAAAGAAIRLYMKHGTIEGPINFTIKSTDDKIRIEDAELSAGLVTSADNIAMEILLHKCLVLHEGVTGGHTSQLLYTPYCLNFTDTNPRVYAKYDSSDSAGSHTDSLLYPA